MAGLGSFWCVTTPRYKRQWTYFGTNLIGQRVSIDSAVARTSCPFLLGDTIEKEVHPDIWIPEVSDKTKYNIKKGFTSNESDNPSLKRMMEQEIMGIVVGKWSGGESVFPAITNEPSRVAEMECNLGEYLSEGEEKACMLCKQTPCIWLSNHDSILACIMFEHGKIPVYNMPTANIRRQKVYQQMAIIINGGLICI
jgi:hypothetical protein